MISNKTIYEYIREYAIAKPSAIYLRDENESLTSEQFLLTVEKTAGELYSQKIRDGDFIAIKAERTVDTIVNLFAVQIIGGIAVMVDPHENIGNLLAEYGINAKAVLEGRVEITENQKSFKPTTDSKKTSVVIFTSGSTGKGKAVMLSQYAFINNAVDTEPLGKYCDDDIALEAIPLCHVFGLALVFIALVLKHSIFIPKYNTVDYLLESIEKYGVTRMNGVPSLYLAMAEKADKYNLSSLRAGFIGGAPSGIEQFGYIERKLQFTLISVYGMSECIGISCSSHRDKIERRAESVGKIYSMNSVRFLNDGEIIVKSPAMFNGYLDGAAGTDEDGYLHTGDLGYLDEEGFLHINGRKKDIIIRNGHNLSAVEMEKKISALGFIREVAVVGVGHEKFGEVPCVAVVLKAGFDFSEKELNDKFKGVLQKNEFPERIIVLRRLPRLSSGKVDKVGIKNLIDNIVIKN